LSSLLTSRMVVPAAAEDQRSSSRRGGVRFVWIAIVALVVGILGICHLAVDDNLGPNTSHRRLPEQNNRLQQDRIERAARMTKMREEAYRQTELRRQKYLNRTASLNLTGASANYVPAGRLRLGLGMFDDDDIDSDADEKGKQKDDADDPIYQMLKNSTDVIVNGVFRKMVR
jgi:hypothetical protein